MYVLLYDYERIQHETLHGSQLNEYEVCMPILTSCLFLHIIIFITEN